MDKAEWVRLYGYWQAKRNRPLGPSFGGRRLVKGRAKGVGQLLSRSRTIPQVGLERVFKTYPA